MNSEELRLALQPELSASSEPDFMEIAAMRNQVYHRIRRAILSGNLEPGTSLNFRAIADALETSVMPVREAMHALLKEGAIEQKNNKTFSVIKLELEEFRELKDIRILLEGRAIREATKHVDEHVIRRLEFYQENIEKYSHTSGLEYLEENYKFHFLIYRAAMMPKLLSFIEMVWLQYAPNLSHFIDERARTGGNTIHRDIIRHLRNRDVEKAHAALVHDIEAAAVFIEEVLTGGNSAERNAAPRKRVGRSGTGKN